EGGLDGKQTELAQRWPGIHTDRKRLGRDLDVQRTTMASVDLVEASGIVGDNAREDVEAAGGALGIAAPARLARQRERLLQRDEVDGAALERRAGRERQLVDDEVHIREVLLREPRLHRLAVREAARATLVG